MPQKTIGRETTRPGFRKSHKAPPTTDGVTAAEIVVNVPHQAAQTEVYETGTNPITAISDPDVNTAADADAQDDREWDHTFATSQDTLARLAARSRAHREAGRTKRIDL